MKKFVRVEHEQREAKYTTPENENSPVQYVSEVIRTKTIKLATDIKKRQIHAKYKHKNLFRNPDGPNVETFTKFRDSQVNFLKNKDNNTYVSDCILLDKNIAPKNVVYVVNDITRNFIILERTKSWNHETQYMETSPVLDFIGPRRLNENQYEKFQRQGIVGSDNRYISKVKHGMRAKEFIKILLNQANLFEDNNTCSIDEQELSYYYYNIGTDSKIEKSLYYFSRTTRTKKFILYKRTTCQIKDLSVSFI